MRGLVEVMEGKYWDSCVCVKAFCVWVSQVQLYLWAVNRQSPVVAQGQVQRTFQDSRECPLPFARGEERFPAKGPHSLAGNLLGATCQKWVWPVEIVGGAMVATLTFLH